MIEILNKILYYVKLLLLLASFGFTFYIVVFMYQRLDKNILDAFSVFLPFAILFVMYAINMILNQKAVKDSVFFNFVSCMVFVWTECWLCIGTCCGYRAVADDFMIAKIRLGYDINFNYFSDMIAPFKIMLYGLSVADIFLILAGVKRKKKKVQDEILTVKVEAK